MAFAVIAWANCIFSLQGNSQDLFAGSGIRRHASFIINARRGAGEHEKKQKMENEEWDDFKNAKKLLGDLYVFLEKTNEIMNGDNGVSTLLSNYVEHMKLFEKTLDVLSDYIETESELNDKAIEAIDTFMLQTDNESMMDLFLYASQEEHEERRDRLSALSEIRNHLHDTVSDNISTFENAFSQFDFEAMSADTRKLEDSCMEIYKQLN